MPQMTPEALELLPAALRDRAEILRASHRNSVRRLLSDAVDAAFAGDGKAAEWCIGVAERRERQAAGGGQASQQRPMPKGAPSVTGIPPAADRTPRRAVQFGLHGTVRACRRDGPVLVATDGSYRGEYPGWGFIAADGQWGCGAAVEPMPASSSLAAPDHGIASLFAELCGAGMALNFVAGPAVLLLDSAGAIRLLRAWQAGDTGRIPAGEADISHGADSPVRPQRHAAQRREILRDIARRVSVREGLEFGHCHGHRGHLLNEAADSLAKMAVQWRTDGEPLGTEAMTARAGSFAGQFLDSWQEGMRTS